MSSILDSRLYQGSSLARLSRTGGLFHRTKFFPGLRLNLGKWWGQKDLEPLNERDIRAIGEGAVEAALFN